ncbi:MAG: MBL fold metallo-hydrolase [Bacteroidales bacterium]|nr:MBL fold metallo-hydrolase [Bacteroidales bacterium]
MKLYKIETGNFKLDGGAMFGVVPKSLWNKVYPADENNMCNLAMRCLLIETNHKLILIDTGIGNKQDDKFFQYYYLNGNDSLLESLQSLNFSPEDITDVILTHLHFDHCGGAVSKNGAGYILTFPNATHWISGPQWRWAMEPNQREKASYLYENIQPIDQSGKLRFIDTEIAFTKDIQLRFFNGHTEGLIVPFIASKNYTLVYVSDLLPTKAHIPVSWICGYDTRPLISMQERMDFLQSAYKNNYVLFFEHDIFTECCTLQETEKGIRVDKTFTLNELFTE